MIVALDLIREVGFLIALAGLGLTSFNLLRLAKELKALVELMKRPLILGIAQVHPADDGEPPATPAEPPPRRDN